jgi:predicted DsbA family dithiol-disulfide isomerase
MLSPTTDHRRLPIDIWSDVLCPFCYLGDTLLAQALAQFSHGDRVDLRYRSFELMPHLPVGEAMGVTELLVREKGMPRAQIDAMNAQLTERGRTLGLDYRFDRALAVNTRAAHRLSHFACSQGMQHALMLQLFRAYFTEGQDLGAHTTLVACAEAVGLDGAAALQALESNAFDAEVTADQQEGRALGVRGVPFFVLDGRYAVSGAQPVETFLKTLEAAWASMAE